MDKSILLDVAKSAIQKGIKRGDLDLVKTAFDILWEDENSRKWLIWKTPFFIVKDAWYMIGELDKFLDSATIDKKEWKKFFYKLTLMTKSKDAMVLLSIDGLKFTIYTEIKIANVCNKEIVNILNGSTDIIKYIASFGIRIDNLNTYEKRSIRFLNYKMLQNGLYLDRLGCLSAIILIVCRRLDEKEVCSIVNSNINEYKMRTKRGPQAVKFDWYNFDSSTTIGKKAIAIFFKKYATKVSIDRKELEIAWNFLESEKIPFNLINYARPKRIGEFYETYWWPYFVKDQLSFYCATPKENRLLWENEICPKMKNIVEAEIEKYVD